MEIVVGIDVSKDRLDVHVWPSGEAFAVPRHHAGLLELQARLDGLGPARIGVEATGGYETVVAASLAGQGHPVVVVTRPRCAPSPSPWTSAPRPTRSTRP